MPQSPHIRHLKLPMRPRPLIGESTRGYLLRVAHANGYNTPRQLWKAIRVWKYSGDRLLRIGVRLRRRALDALSGPYPSFCNTHTSLSHCLRNDDYNHTEFRWCPFCLADSEFVRGEWELKLCCVCVTHKVLLCDRCPRCDSPQAIVRNDVARCACGAHLALAKAQPAATSLIALHELLIAYLNGKRLTSAIEVTPEHWLRMVKYFGQFGLAYSPKRPGQVAALHKLSNALAITTATAHLLLKWPQHFHALLDRLSAPSRDSMSISQTYGRLYRSLYVDLSAPCFQFLRDAFEAYLHDHWFGMLGKRNRRLGADTIERHPRKPLHVLARENRTGKSVVKHLAHAGAIEGAAIKHASGRTTWAFPTAAMLQVKECLADTLNLGQARKILGLNKRRVHELINDHLLRAWINPDNTKSLAWSLSKKDVQTLANIGISRTSDNLDEGKDWVTLRRILKGWRLHPDEFVAIIRAIQSGTLQSSRKSEISKGMCEVRVDANQVREWLCIRREKAQLPMSIDAAAKLLGVKQQVAYELVRKGLLATVLSEDGTQRGRRVHQHAIEAFQKQFVALTDIARAHRVGVRRALNEIPIAPICGPRIDCLRQYFYRRCDLMGLRFNSNLELVLAELP
jgi:hypothetical protein